MLNVKFIVDATSDIPHDVAEKNNISVIGIPIIFEDGTSKLDWVEMDHREFYERLEKSADIPKTSQPPMEAIKEALTDGAKNYDAVIYTTISSRGSGTYQTANILKSEILEEYPDAKIVILDSMSYSLFIVDMVFCGIRLAKEGKNLDEIVAGMKNERTHTEVLVTVDTLKYLEKGGRINKASMIIGSLLDIKPVLTVLNGLMENVDKFRGAKSVIPKMVKRIRNSGNYDESRPEFYIVHSQCPEKADALWEAIKAEFGDEAKLTLRSEIGATVGTHIGPGTLAVFYKINPPDNVYED